MVGMEKTIQTDAYQDPLESAFEKCFPWTAIFTDFDDHAAIHITSGDFSGREFALPAGAIIEMADALLLHRATQSGVSLRDKSSKA